MYSHGFLYLLQLHGGLRMGSMLRRHRGRGRSHTETLLHKSVYRHKEPTANQHITSRLCELLSLILRRGKEFSNTVGAVMKLSLCLLRPRERDRGYKAV